MCIAVRTPHFIAATVFAVVALFAPGNMAMAQQPQPPSVGAFLANPGLLLQQHQTGGQALAAAVEQLALSDSATFKILIGLVPSANRLQKAAIGEGLAKAAKLEVSTNQTMAAEWQQQIAAITDPEFYTAAIGALGDVRLGAVGGGPLGAAGGGGGGGGQTNPLNLGPQPNGAPLPNAPNPVPTPFFTFSYGTVPTAAPTRSVSE
jgi:hypothetical protein